MQLRVHKRGLGPAWYLDRVEVADTTSLQHTVFPFQGWIQDSTGWQHDLLPEGQAGAAVPLVEYQVTVCTSDVRGAGAAPAS